MTFNKSLVDRLKKELKAQKDQDLAEIFNVSPFVFSSWKRSKGRLIEEVVKYGINNNLNFNSVFHTNNDEEDQEISILMAENLFSYYLNPEETISKLPKYSIPIANKSKLGFQVISQNMEPTLNVSAIVFGVQISLRELKSKDIYVLNVLNKGIFIMRYANQSEEGYVFENDNSSFPDLIFKENDLATVFRVNAMLSKFE